MKRNPRVPEKSGNLKKTGKRKTEGNKTPPPPPGVHSIPGPVESVRLPDSWMRAAWVLPILLAALLYSGVYGHGLVYWDDAPMIEKAWRSPLTLDYAVNVFKRFHGTYQPLRDLSYALDARLFGERLWGFQLHNVVLYCLNVWLVFLVSRRWFERIQAYGRGGADSRAVPNAGTLALWAAALFAAHPLHVEAVAWLAARKEVLVGLFFLSAMWFFMEMDRVRGYRRWMYWAASYLAYVLALLSKPTAAALPVVLLCYDVILIRPLPDWKRRVWVHLPFWLPAAAAAVYFSLFAGTTETILAEGDLVRRIMDMNRVLVHNVFILAVPIGLSARYAFEFQVPFWDPFVVTGVILHAVLAACFIVFLRRNRLTAFFLAWFYITFLPTSGLIPIPIQAADRYLYLPSLAFCCIAPLVMTEKAGPWLQRRFPAAGRMGVLVVLLFLLGSYSWITVQQVRIWRDDYTLWSHTAAVSPTDLAYFSLGEAYYRRGDWARAEANYRLALEINPAFPNALNSLGSLMLLDKRIREAEELYLKALEVDPKHPHAHRHLAMAYITMKRYDRALNHAEKAFRWGARDPVLLDMLCRLYYWRKQPYELVRTAHRLGRFEAEAARAHMYLSHGFQMMGNPEAARRHHAQAYELDARLAAETERMLSGPSDVRE